ncbi:hypothetical protein ONZ43_g4043 [Nemania bipapillata]|uniref:Uncharacterized protein n=1 Tax=Nemania bipapillata TaxID=110536 RepID=A0ACC2ISM1_9PEZI|nr:hypothetical protein ONZ43_g4043 [Nemania bipapillata]
MDITTTTNQDFLSTDSIEEEICWYFVTTPELELILHKHAQVIQSLYDNGTPLFTKESLKRVGQQLDQYVEGRLEKNEMLIEDIMGNTIRFPIPEKPAPTLISRDNKLGKLRPEINYGTIQGSKIEAEFHGQYLGWHPQTAYLMLIPSWAHEDTVENTKFSVSQLGQILTDHKAEWQTTEEYHVLKSLVGWNPGFSKVRKIVGIALGALVEEDKEQRDSLMQYSLLLSLRELIMQRGVTEDVRCFAQDPALCPTAATVLEDAGIAVLDNPYAFTEVDDTTIVVSMYSNVPVKQIVTDIARPLAIMWTEPEVEADKINLSDPMSTRVESMLKNEYENLDFPYYQPFGEISLYLRKE